MNWNRPAFKERAKGYFQHNYWPCIAVSVLLALLGGSGTHFNFTTSFGGVDAAANVRPWDGLSGMDSALFLTVLGIILAAAAVGACIGIVFGLLVSNPYKVGACRFYMENRYRMASFSAVGAGFSGNFGNVVLTRFLEGLFIFLWSLLLIVPGIVKSYAYFAVPYILAENPHLNHSRVLELSRQMTYGWKGEIFITGLSFIPWHLLNALTLGILGIFYVNPYIHATEAEIYRFLREEALRSGIATWEELPGFGDPDEPQAPNSLPEF